MQLRIFIPAIILLIALFMVTRNLLFALMGMGDYRLSKKRYKELKSTGKEKTKTDVYTLSEKVTSPLKHLIFNILGLNLTNEEELQRNLDLVKAPFDAKGFYALSLTCKIIAVIGAMMTISSKPLAGLIFVVFWFGPKFLLNNELKEKKQRILFQLPDFLRLVQANLMTGFILRDAVERSVPKVGPEWRKLGKQLYIDMDLVGDEQALVNLKRKVDIPEVREFISIIGLAVEQGESPDKVLEAQEKNILSIIADNYDAIVEKRRIWTIIIQGPLMIVLLMLFALPLVSQFGQIL